MHLPRPVQIVPTAATWARLALIASGLFAAGAAHFAGFLSSLPDTLQPLVATSMAAGFFGTFLFYVASVFVVSRLVAQFFIAGITLLQYVLARFRRLSPVRRVREHLVMLALERWSVRIVQACIFVFIFAKTYLGLLDRIGYRLLVAIGVVFAILALVSLFARAWPFVSLSKVLLMLEGRRRSRLQAALLNSMVTFGVGLVLVLAYLAGEMRQNALW